MRSVTRICKLAFLPCFFLFIICPVIVGQNTAVGVNPSLRQLQTLYKPQQSPVRDYAIVETSPKKLLQFFPELKGFVPAGSQDELVDLLKKVGANEDGFLYAVPNLASQEEVVHEKLDKHGWVKGLPIFTGHYRYMIKAHTTGEGIRFSEGRADETWRQIDAPVTSGLTLAQNFAVFPLQFHPVHQTATKFRYLGRQVLDNRQDYVVAFQQEPERSQMTGMVSVNGHEYQVAYQGIAWIEPDNFQIVRMRIDLLKPRAEVASQMTDIQLSELRLPLVTKPLWLPSDVVVTRPTQDGGLRETHKFSNYMVFVSEAKTVPSSQASPEKPK